MTTISARQLSREYSKVLQRVKDGETIGIVVNDEVVAVLHSPDNFEIKEKKDMPDKGVQGCELEYLNNLEACKNQGVSLFHIPDDWQKLGKDDILLCEKHFQEVSNKTVS